ncbi:hypothetical protein [Acinetobacter pittii]|uniref:hypothetical protein n=1 Tax=Acinetobacter pittii TaxID=48296 RepID=UPI0024DE8711|nr:hypothetical protein [Acinetobacter pittii]
MGETNNISLMANLISDEIFSVFNWVSCPALDQNWVCVEVEHEKEKHPADVVFYYFDPYTNIKNYIHTDLKSFSKSTIENTDLDEIIKSLSMQVECSENSPEWQKLYSTEQDNFVVHGMLFIYNHDNQYLKPISGKIANIDTNLINIPRHSRIVIFTPADIHWLNNVANHIIYLKGKKQLSDNYTFFYPQRKSQATIGKSKYATLEVLTSPWIILEDTLPNKSEKIITLFYRPSGEEEDEFIYLLDYLRQNSLLEEDYKITIYQLDQDKFAPTVFDKAKIRYINNLDITDEKLLNIINNINLLKINNIKSSFSEVEIGMKERTK